MTSNSRYALDPVETPGICHVDGLSKESADMANRVLQANRNAHHVFTTNEEIIGVSSALM